MVQIAQSGLKRIARGQGEGECKQACNVDIMEATQSRQQLNMYLEVMRGQCAHFPVKLNCNLRQVGSIDNQQIY